MIVFSGREQSSLQKTQLADIVFINFKIILDFGDIGLIFGRVAPEFEPENVLESLDEMAIEPN